LLTLATTSVIGTLVPQNRSPQVDYQAYGDFIYRFFSILDIFNMYHSWWFQLLLIFLCINIIICSINRLSATWKIIFIKTPNFNASRFRQLSDSKSFLSNHPPKDLVENYRRIATRGFSYRKVEESKQGYCIFAEKNRLSRLGVYVVHLSILILLIGALVGSYFGFEGHVEIPEGEAIDHVQMYNSTETLPLGFLIRCDSFNVSYYDSGAPKEFRSTLTIIDQGKPVLQKDIVPNRPLRYKGINLFQSSFGNVEPIDITLDFKIRNTEKSYRHKIKFKQWIELPGGLGKFSIQDYRQSYQFGGQNLGEVFIGMFVSAKNENQEIVLPTRFPIFDRMRNGDFSASVADVTYRYFTGLGVTKDPGVWVVYTGFIIMIIGCYITFFVYHQQVCIELNQDKNGSRIMIGGIVTKNNLAAKKITERIFKRLQRIS